MKLSKALEILEKIIHILKRKGGFNYCYPLPIFPASTETLIAKVSHSGLYVTASGRKGHSLVGSQAIITWSKASSRGQEQSAMGPWTVVG